MVDRWRSDPLLPVVGVFDLRWHCSGLLTDFSLALAVHEAGTCLSLLVRCWVPLCFFLAAHDTGTCRSLLVRPFSGWALRRWIWEMTVPPCGGKGAFDWLLTVWHLSFSSRTTFPMLALVFLFLSDSFRVVAGWGAAMRQGGNVTVRTFRFG